MPHTPLIAWIGFHIFILAMLGLDLGVFHRKSHSVRFREAVAWSAVWIALALVFNVGIYYFKGKGAALEFLTAYLIEKSLSVDNLFIFLTIFSYFKVPAKYQHKVLFWGVVGAVLMRAAFIFAGVVLIQRFHWITYLFGAFLVFTGVKLVFDKEHDIEVEKNIAVRLVRRFFRITQQFREGHFLVHEDGRWLATPLFLVLVFVETTDLIFALDSIPAVLAISSDPFIVYTSNIFAILGLRALFFALANLMSLFHLLKYGLATILVFIGIKMMAAKFWHIPTIWALAAIAFILTVSITASYLFPEKKSSAVKKS